MCCTIHQCQLKKIQGKQYSPQIKLFHNSFFGLEGTVRVLSLHSVCFFFKLPKLQNTSICSFCFNSKACKRLSYIELNVLQNCCKTLFYFTGSSTIGPVLSLMSSITVLCLRAAFAEKPFLLLGGNTYSMAGTSAESN